MDLRSDKRIMDDLEKEGSKPVSLAEGEFLKRKINAHKYMECSAKGNKGVKVSFKSKWKPIFDEAVRAKLYGKKVIGANTSDIKSEGYEFFIIENK